jgi:hypothetical protein
VRRSFLFIALTMWLTACTRESLYGGGDFSQDVHDSFADCNEAEIKRLAMAHNIQTAFGRCGSNRFSHFAWSPDGIHLYFQLTHGAHILNGEEKTITTVPTEGPTSGAAWLSPDIIAIPLPPAEGQSAERIAIYNRTAATIEMREITADLSPYNSGLLFTALDDQGVRRPYTMDLNTGDLTRVFPWLTQPVNRLSVSEKADLLTWSSAKDTELVRLSSGKSLHLFPGVSRAVPHADGRWIALETEGAEISHFDQRTWNEISPEARKRELARQEKWAERQPEWVEMSVKPPEVQLFDLRSGERYRITAFWGDDLAWYPSKGLYLAFMMWGIEGKQLNRNVGLTSLAERIRMIDADQMPLGVKPVAQPESAE